MSIIVNEENDNKKVYKNVQCEYIVGCGTGQYGRSNVMVVFKNGNDPLFWITGSKVKQLSAFEEGKTYDIACIRYNNSRYISNVRPAEKGE